MRKLMCFFLLCTWSVLLFAQNGPSSEAKYSGAFLEIPVGVRAAGMGTAFTSVANDGSAFFWNPSGSSLSTGTIISTQYSSQFGSISDPLGAYFFTGYQQNLEGLGAFSVNWIRLSVDDIKKYGVITDTKNGSDVASLIANGSIFNNAQDAVYINISKEFNPIIDFGWQFFKVPYKIPFGLNLKYIRNSFGGQVNQSSYGFGLDAGFMIINDFNDYFSKKVWGVLSFGLTVRDVTNTIVTWNSKGKQFSIPRSYSWGISYSQPISSYKIELLVAYQSMQRYENEDDVGIEVCYDKRYSLRIGSYKSEFTLGMGLKIYGGINIDYSFQKNELGNPHRIGLSVNTGNLVW